MDRQEEELHRQLDLTPEDWILRSILADFYRDRGDEDTADSLDFATRNGYRPIQAMGKWWWYTNEDERNWRHRITRRVYPEVMKEVNRDKNGHAWAYVPEPFYKYMGAREWIVSFATRREAENGLRKAYECCHGGAKNAPLPGDTRPPG